MEDKYDKIGGWLMLLGIGIVLSPFILAYGMLETYTDIFTSDTWEILTSDVVDSSFKNFSNFIVVEFAANIIIFMLSVYLIYLFLDKKEKFKKWYLAIALFSAVTIGLDFYITHQLFPNDEIIGKEELRDLKSILVRLLVWTPYLFISKRAKGTFVNK